MSGGASPGTGYRGRFAPSPTGDLHPGSLLAAFGSWLLARHAGGRWMVRIEDIDPPREVAGAVDRQLRDLSALGLVSDEAVMRQSTRDDAYRQALDRLLAQDLAFECHCSRADLVDHGGIHRACVARHRRSNPAVRLRVPDGSVVGFVDGLQGQQIQDVAREVGDFVLRRADGYWGYQLAVVVDDAAQGITDVVRGADLLDSTPRQILLQRALGVPTPRYLHLPLLVGADGHKLSTSEAATALDPDRPLPALRAAWAALGQSPEALAGTSTVAELLGRAQDAFDPDALPRHAKLRSGAAHNSSIIFPA